MGKKKDIRSIHTEAILEDSLAQLLSQKELKKITIRELTSLSGINRATFYDHYSDIYDLYEKMMDTFFQKLKSTMTDNSIVSYSDFYCVLIDLLCNDMFIGKLVLSTPRFILETENFFISSCINTWKQEWEITNITSEIELAAAYRVNGCIGILKKWVNNECSISAEALKAYISSLDKKMDNSLRSFIFQ